MRPVRFEIYCEGSGSAAKERVMVRPMGRLRRGRRDPDLMIRARAPIDKRGAWA